MKSVTFSLPKEIHFNIPTQYATYCNGDPVHTLDERCPNGLVIRWDDSFIEFISDRGGVSYRRSGIKGWQADYRRRIMGRELCEMLVFLEDGGFPVVYTEASHRVLFDEFVALIKSTDSPIDFPDESGRVVQAPPHPRR